jgi:hypothetical protein
VYVGVFVFCQVLISVAGVSLKKRIPIEYGVPECCLETSTMRGVDQPGLSNSKKKVSETENFTEHVLLYCKTR